MIDKKVIIIGNGSSILNKENGDLIDSFDVVVRINDFKTKGYELYTGNKTDILFTCRLDIYNSMEQILRFPLVIVCGLTDPWNGVKASEQVLLSWNLKRINWSEIHHLRDLVGMEPPCYPSTGMMAIYCMIQYYGHVTITGFDNFKGGNRHYYEEGERMDPSPHAPDIQEYYIKNQERIGNLTVL